jgi:hypothetical protein
MNTTGYQTKNEYFQAVVSFLLEKVGYIEECVEKFKMENDNWNIYVGGPMDGSPRILIRASLKPEKFPNRQTHLGQKILIREDELCVIAEFVASIIDGRTDLQITTDPSQFGRKKSIYQVEYKIRPSDTVKL